MNGINPAGVALVGLATSLGALLDNPGSGALWGLTLSLGLSTAVSIRSAYRQAKSETLAQEALAVLAEAAKQAEAEQASTPTQPVRTPVGFSGGGTERLN